MKEKTPKKKRRRIYGLNISGQVKDSKAVEVRKEATTDSILF